jgi:O-Antigen ligase
METTSMRPGGWVADFRRRLDWAAVGTWLLSFGLIIYLGLEGGGFDPLVHDQVGIAAWWVVLATVLAGALPRRQMGRAALTSLILLGAFALWIALSLIWTESAEQTFADIARVATYLGVFGLALMTRDARETQRLIGAVAAGIAVVVAVALLSRLHPSLFHGAEQTGKLLASEDRLSFPLNYWNALAALTAIGVPLLLQLATGARSIWARALSAAALPAFALVLYFTLSRGGIAAAAAAVLIFLAIASDRLPKLLTVLIAGAGGALLVALGHQRDELREGLTTATAHHQGNELMLIILAVCAVVGLLQAGVALASTRFERPVWSRPSRQAATIALGACVVALIVAAGVANAPGRVSDAWGEFKSTESGPGEGTGRLSSVAGESRYQFWSSALDENATAPLIGTGSGTFQYWWTREGDGAETVRDTHSLYMQTLGEVGIVGLLLLVGFLGFVLVAGILRAFSAAAEERTRLAAAVAGLMVFVLTAAVDWMWQVPVVPVAALLLATGLVTAGSAATEKPRLPVGARIGVVAFALVAIVAIAIPLASTTLVRQSEADVRVGDLNAALDSAQSAQNVQPGAASPRLQEALVLEIKGDYPGAEEAAVAATEREETNWRNWLVLSRIAAERGQAKNAVSAYKEARSLNPHASIFER